MILNKDWFCDTESLQAFVYASKVLDRLQGRGLYLVDDYGNTYDPDKGKVVFNGKDSEVLLDGTWLVGCTHDEDGRIYSRIEDVQDFFKRDGLKVLTKLDVEDFL
ncbi:hypothetical protein [Vibrio phage VCPH]|nr:hypothetical protein [Vibrio phage VCPH]